MSEALTTETTVVAPPAEGNMLGGTASAPAAGDASVSGSDGTDSVSGVEGTDTLEGATGNDTVSAGDGTDSVTAVEYDLKLPEGVEVDNDAMGQLTEFAKTNGLSKEAAQAALDLHIAQMTAQGEAFASAQTKAWETTIATWQSELKAMPEFAGEKAAAAQVIIGRALDQFGDQATRDAFVLTGAGHHPAIIKFVHNMAKMLSEGDFVPAGTPPKGSPKSLGETLYGSEGT